MNRISKKLMALFLTAAVFISLAADFTVSATAYSGKLESGLSWDYSSGTHTLTISGRGAMDEWYDELEELLYERPWEDFLDSIYNIVISDGVTSIGGGAFAGCTMLSSVKISSSVIRIGTLAFYLCPNLSSVSLPSGITSFGIDTFADCEKLKFNFYDNAKYLGNADDPYLVLVEAKSKTITSCTVNAKTKCIASAAFFECSKLTKVNISSGLTSICSYAFLSCPKLTSLKIPDTVTTVELDAFFDSGIKLNSYDNANYIGNDKNPYHVLVEAKNTDITNCNVNSKTKHIAEGAFMRCTALESISLPSSVMTVDAGAFAFCEGLKTVKMPEVKSIGSIAFTGCVLLSSVEMPKATEIGSYAFTLCTSLQSIAVPEGITRLEDGVFAGCGITSVALPDSVKYIYNSVFDGCESLDTVYYGGTAYQKNSIYIADGNSKLKDSTWVFTQCNAGHTYKNDCESLCDICGYKRVPPHRYTDVWRKDKENHWHECSLCHVRKDIAGHVFDGDDDSICDICGFDKDAKYIPGDVDLNGTVDPDDAIYVLYHIYFLDAYSVDQSVDYDGNGREDPDDAIYLLYHVYFPEDYPLA